MKKNEFKKLSDTLKKLQAGYFTDRKKVDRNFKPEKRYGDPTRKEHILYFLKIIDIIRQESQSKKLRILDIGLGGGTTAACICSLVECDYYAIEHPKAKQMEYSTFRGVLKKYNIELKLADITKQEIPFEKNYFDIILFTEVLEHIHVDKVKGIFDNLKKVLKNGGIIILSTPNFLSLFHRIQILLGKTPDFDLGITPMQGDNIFRHVREYSSSELVKLIKILGFNVREIIMCNLAYGSSFLTLINNMIGVFFSNTRNDIILVVDDTIAKKIVDI